jgi:FKBP-type peptidyl-prolyl cis-trans isomerase (trigger factor)
MFFNKIRPILREEIDIKIPWSETGKDYEKFLSKFGKDIKLQGFRKGKAPLKIIEKKHGPTIEWEFIKENFWTY